MFTWRRRLREGILVEPQAATFLPVRMLEAEPSASDLMPPVLPAAPARPQQGLIEIELGGGLRLRVGSDVNLAALRRVLVAPKA